MIDFSDTLSKNNDVQFFDTTRFKARNLLKTTPAQNPYYTQVGFTLLPFINNNVKGMVIKSAIATYLTRFYVNPQAITLQIDSKGVVSMQIQIDAEVFNV